MRRYASLRDSDSVVMYGWRSLLIHRSARRLKIDHEAESNNSGLCPAGIIRHQFFDLSE